MDVRTSRWPFFITSVALGAGCVQGPDAGISEEELVTCDVAAGSYRTQTMGGWGARPRGGNPGAYLHANFERAFPAGLTIGCDRTLTLRSAAAVTAFLPSGSTGSVLPRSLVDPTRATYSNVLAGQLVAATLSVRFDESDPDFGSSELALGALEIASGPLAGLTVSELLAEANLALGGCASAYPIGALVSELDRFNRSFDDGTSYSAALTCPAVPERWMQCDNDEWLEEPRDVVALGEDALGRPVATTLECVTPHEMVLLPEGFDTVECTSHGLVRYVLGPLSEGPDMYFKLCDPGDPIVLDEVGGPAAIRCPDEGSVRFFQRNLFGGLSPRLLPCAPGAVIDTEAYFGLSSLGTNIVPQIGCPASGTVSVHYYGEGAPPLSPYAVSWRSASCIAGTPTALNDDRLWH